jgi:hypothetical protein
MSAADKQNALPQVLIQFLEQSSIKLILVIRVHFLNNFVHGCVGWVQDGDAHNTQNVLALHLPHSPLQFSIGGGRYDLRQSAFGSAI